MPHLVQETVEWQPCDNANEPTLIQHRRDGDRWTIRNYPYGATFTTKLLPDFQLVIDPRK